MTEPTTEAGRALLATLNKYLFEEPSENEAPILAIEQEARAALLADLRERVAGIYPNQHRLLTGWHECLDRAAVLDLLASQDAPASVIDE